MPGFGPFAESRRSFFPPCAGHQQDQHRIEFQPSQQHVDAQHDLRKRREKREVPRWAAQPEAGADVVERGEHGRQRRRAVIAVERDEQHRGCGDQHIQYKIGTHRTHRLAGDGLAVNGNDLDGVRMQDLAQLRLGRAHQDDHARDLQSAARRPGARTDDHEEHQDHAGKLRPQVKVLRAEARRGDDGGDGKGRVMQAVAEIATVELHDVAGDEQRRAENDRHIPAQLRVLPRQIKFSAQQEEIDREIHAEQRHKDRCNCLRIRAVGGEGVVFDGKAARARRAERIAERIEQRIAARQI